jgi:DNA polymerase elongation subunit (family B)
LDFNIIEWWGADINIPGENITDHNGNEIQKKDERYNIFMYGRTKEGISIECKVLDFNPFYYIKLPDNVNAKIGLRGIKKYISENFWMCKTMYYEDPFVSAELIKSKDIYGFTNGEEYNFVKVSFKSHRSMKMSRNLFKAPVKIQLITNENIKYKLYESNFEPFMRFAHIQDIKMAGWVKVENFELMKNENVKKCEKCISVNWKNAKGININEIAPFVQMSWDIEVYSHDYTFPDPFSKISVGSEKVYPNEIYQIGITFKSVGSEEDSIRKMILTTKECSEIENARIVYEKCEKDLIKRFAEIVEKYNPDVIFGYNTDNFDFDYTIKRIQVLDNNIPNKWKKKVQGALEKWFLKKLSRNSVIESILKKESFSSSAYGDSTFMRLYMPGRLNYDLLIHYKRGMIKYSSYKLDNIAHEILGENKHAVSVKDIFKSYENGSPDDICRIAKYCIQDTELLQRLVDKQIILLNIIQLSNVTYVPLSYHTTRGQTIKVLSQTMKKAREMGYLVPHTNFNSDNNILTLKLKSKIDPERFENLKGEYIMIDCGKMEYEWEDKMLKKEFIINGKLEEVISDMCITIITDTCLEENETIFKKKDGQKWLGDLKGTIADRGYILDINTISNDEMENESFTGASVLEPKRGLHLENVVVLDFASLYPTIMISRNLCFSTLIDTEVWSEELLKEKDIKYEVIEWDDTITYKLNRKCEKIMCGGKRDKEICGKDAKFNENEYKYYICNECKFADADTDVNMDVVDILNPDCDGDKCRKKAKWSNGINDYCEKCNDSEDLSFELIPKILEKCEMCGKTAKRYILKKGNYYFCLIHDPFKKSRSDENKILQKKVKYRYLIAQNGLGVVPSLLQDLYKERKAVKKQMYNASGVLKDILDCQQLSIKVSLNSVYGFMGRTKGNLVKGELGRLTTAVGRMLIEQSKDFAENGFDTKGKIKEVLEVVKMSEEEKKNICVKYNLM